MSAPSPSPDLLLPIAEALLEGGVPAVEVTMSTPKAIAGIEMLADRKDADVLVSLIDGRGSHLVGSVPHGYESALWRAHAELGRLVQEPDGRGEADFQRRTARDIAGFNPAGLCDPAKNNLYPFV